MGIEYKGKLYGRIGDQIIPLQETSEDVDRMRRIIARLRKYAQHRIECERFNIYQDVTPRRCTCGLDKLLDEINEEASDGMES